MIAYYNEIDPDAAAILRQCITDGVIAPGDVDTRSIKQVQADDLRGYSQCHFFAGGGLWSVAARMAGWPDDRSLWTGSCPCQPFSAAGKGAGVDDPRHLWPDLLRLVRDATAAGFGPPVLMGEQVSGAAGYGWLDGVRADLAGENYACRARDIPACAVDAPHQRSRLYWVAVEHAESERRGEGRTEYELRGRRPAASGANASGALGHGAGDGRQISVAGRQPAIEGAFGAAHSFSEMGNDSSAPARWHAGAVSSPEGSGQSEGVEPRNIADGLRPADDRNGNLADRSGASVVSGRPGEASGAWTADDGQARSIRRSEFADTARLRNGSAWADAEWLTCHDGKAQRAKPGIRLLVDGLPGRVGLWRVGGNAIVPVLAAEVIGAFLGAEEDLRAAE